MFRDRLPGLIRWFRREPKVPKSRFSEEERTHIIRQVETALRANDTTRAAAELAVLQADVIEHPYAYHLAGVIAGQRGDPVAAAAGFEKAAALDPTLESAWRSLVAIRTQLGDEVGLVAALRGVLSIQPNDRHVLNALVGALARSGDHDAAIETYQMHRVLDWHFDPSSNPAAVLQAQGKLAEAAAQLREAVARDRRNAALWVSLGCTRQAQAHLDTAIACFREAVTIDPGFAPALRKLAFALDSAGEVSEAIPFYRAAIEAVPNDPQVYSDYLAAQIYLGWDSVAVEEAAHREYDRRVAAVVMPSPLLARAPIAGRRLRVGYVSGDFCEHAITHFFEPVLERHDRTAFEVICYDRTMQRDATSERLESLADAWHTVPGQDWERVAQRIREDRIDVLVDLKGHFEDNHLPLFARKPAPVQVNWLGYPGTTGLAAVDAWLSDRYIEADLSGQYASERIVPLGDFFMCFRPKAGAPELGPLPALSSGQVTFGCLNTYAKVSEPMRDAIAAILTQVPGSRCLFTAVPRGNARTRLLQRFESAGIDPGRIEIRGRGSHDEFLRAHREIDISLDSFPYNGTTTALYSLWMGVPFVTLCGTSHVSRVGYSILRNAGLGDWVARNAGEYVSLAVAHARDLDRLAQLRAASRARLAASPVMDEAGFVRQLELGYLGLAATKMH